MPKTVDLSDRDLYTLSSLSWLPSSLSAAVREEYAQFKYMHGTYSASKVYHDLSFDHHGRVVSRCGRLDTAWSGAKFSITAPDALRKCKWCCMTECC